MARILSLGTGSLASQLPNFLSHTMDIIGVKRSLVHLDGMEMYQCDLAQNNDAVKAILAKIKEVDIVIYTATPGARRESQYRETYCDIPAKVMSLIQELGWKPYWVHVSSTGVFHHSHAEWVHENTEPAPLTTIARLLRQSELIVESYPYGASILRLGGLYGQGRTHLVNALKAGRPIQSEPWSFTNRTHREDAVRAIAFLVERALEHRAKKHKASVEYFHAVDHDPAPLHEVADFLAQQHQLPSPRYFQKHGADAVGTQNKRVGNRKLIEAGFQFRFTSYRQGL